MTNEQITLLVSEFKEGYQIPPYFSNEVITEYANRGIHELSILDENVDFIDDHVARGLLFTYMHYCYYHRENEFRQDCRCSILTWQMSKVGDEQ